MTDAPFGDSYPTTTDVLCETSNEFGELAKALAGVQAKMKPAAKDTEGQIGTVKRKYADLMSVMNVAQPLCGDAGLAVLQSAERINGEDFLATRLVHSSGQWIRGRVPIHVEAEHKGINNAQAYGAAMTYARRYGLAAILGVVTDDDDDGKGAGDAQGERSSKKQQQQQQKAPSDTDEFAVCIQFHKPPGAEQKKYLQRNGFIWNGEKFRWEAPGTDKAREVGDIILTRQPDLVKSHKGIRKAEAAEDPSAEPEQPPAAGGDDTPSDPPDDGDGDKPPDFANLTKALLMGTVQAMEKKLPGPTVDAVRPDDIKKLNKDGLVAYAQKLYEMTQPEGDY